MHRLAATLATVALAAPSALAQASSAPPQNVLILVADDCGPGLIGAYDDYYQSIGRPSQTAARTPAIDSLLAARGLTFTRAWSAPLCTPARAMLLSGRYGFRTGIGQVLKPRGFHQNPGVQPSVELLPGLLSSNAAYSTAAVGKWHLSSEQELTADPLAPLGQPAGHWFQRFAGTMFNLPVSPSAPAWQSGYYGWNKFYATELVPGVDPCGTGVVPCSQQLYAATVSGYPTVDTTEDALALMQTMPEPWLVYVSYHAVHKPAHRPPPGLPLAACGSYVPPSSSCNPGPNPSEAELTRCMLTALDSQIGRLLCAIDDSDTTVIFLGDNGTPKDAVLPPYPPQHFKGSVYQGGLEVPLIIRSPLLAPNLLGQFDDHLVHVVDLFGTVCDLAQIAVPPASDAVSLRPCLTGQGAPLRKTLYSEQFAPNFVPQPAPGWLPPGYVAHHHDQALRDERFKLVRKWRRAHGTGATMLIEELYDLQQGGPLDTTSVPPSPTPDWFEANDLLASGAPLPPVADQALRKLRAELDQRYPTVMP